MRELAGDQMLVRIYIGESDRWQSLPLHRAILERLRREGFAGATVFHGTAGFGAGSVVHTSDVLRLSQDLPVVIEIVDSATQVERLLPVLDEMVDDGFVTIEKVSVLKYEPGRRHGAKKDTGA